MAETPLLELRDLSFAYPESPEPVLRHVDFVFSPGQRVGLFGPNGSGKTTLLHLMMGLVAPTGGEVRYRGRPMATEADFREVRRGVGLLLQNAEDQIIYPTVLDDVAFGPLNLGLAPALARVRAEETLAALGLYGFEERLCHKLSGGEKKLVSLAGVLAMQPEALLLDEPTNGLDPDTRDRIKDILARLGKPFIVISHDWDFLDQTATAFYTIDRGSLTPTPQSVLHRHLHSHPLGDAPHHHH